MKELIISEKYGFDTVIDVNRKAEEGIQRHVFSSAVKTGIHSLKFSLL